jgi:hypothetical protein
VFILISIHVTHIHTCVAIFKNNAVLLSLKPSLRLSVATLYRLASKSGPLYHPLEPDEENAMYCTMSQVTNYNKIDTDAEVHKSIQRARKCFRCTYTQNQPIVLEPQSGRLEP